MGPIPLPDASKLLSRELSVNDYFETITLTLTANLGGHTISPSRLVNIILGLWTATPTLHKLASLLTAHQRATPEALKEAIRQFLYPGGEQALHHDLIKQFYARRQTLVEMPLGSGLWYPEPAITYVSDKLHLISKVPAAQQPPASAQIHCLIQDLQHVLRPQVLAMAHPYPATVKDAISLILLAERAISQPMCHPSSAASAAHDLSTSTSGYVSGAVRKTPPTQLLPSTSSSSPSTDVYATPRDLSQFTASIRSSLNAPLQAPMPNSTNAHFMSVERHSHYGPHQPLCGYCGKPFHIAAYCWKNPAGRNYQGRGPYAGRGGYGRGGYGNSSYQDPGGYGRARYSNSSYQDPSEYSINEGSNDTEESSPGSHTQDDVIKRIIAQALTQLMNNS